MTDNRASDADGVILDWQTFQKVELRIGTVINVEPNIKARVPAYVLDIDLGHLGIKRSSAQITQRYRIDDLVGRQVICVTNFPPKRVAGIKSEVLVTGFPDSDGSIILATAAADVPNGERLI